MLPIYYYRGVKNCFDWPDVLEQGIVLIYIITLSKTLYVHTLERYTDRMYYLTIRYE